jgi:drug/metabolite transporter (DMT)-like permease
MSNRTHASPDLDAKATLILTGCCCIWGIGMVMVKLANAGISPVLNSGLRSVVAAVLLFALATVRGTSVTQRDGTLRDGLLTGLVFALEFLFLYIGLSMTTVSRGIIFLHCAPFVAAYGEHLFVPGHRLTGARVLGLLAAFAGLVVAMGDGLWTGVSQTILLGDLFCLLGGVFWGLTTVIIRAGTLRAAPAEKTLLYQLVVSAVVLLAWSFVSGEAKIGDLTASVLGAFAYTVVLTVVIGYQTWFWLMRSYSAASLHAFTFLTPIFGVIAGHLVLGEPLTLGTIAGLALVASGIYLVNRPSREPATA